MMVLQEDQAYKKGPWTPEEDMILIDYIQRHGEGNWKEVGKKSGLNRLGKSCRERWVNHLKHRKKGAFTEEEVQLILQLHDELGNKWSRIAKEIPGRNDNEIKNLWHSRLSKRRPNVDSVNVHQLKTQSNSTGPSSFVPTPTVPALDSMLSKKRPNASTLDNVKVHQSKKQPSPTGPSSFTPTPTVTTLDLLNKSCSPSRGTLFNSQKNQPLDLLDNSSRPSNGSFFNSQKNQQLDLLNNSCSPSHGALFNSQKKQPLDLLDNSCRPSHGALLNSQKNHSLDLLDNSCRPSPSALFNSQKNQPFGLMDNSCRPSHGAVFNSLKNQPLDLVDNSCRPSHGALFNSQKNQPLDLVDNSCSPSHGVLFNSQKNQQFPIPTYINYDLEPFQSNHKNPFLGKGFSYSVPAPSMLQSSPSNFPINSHLDVQRPSSHSNLVLRPASATTYSSDRRMTSNATITYRDNKDTIIKAHGDNRRSIPGDELLRLIDSSMSSKPIPEWNELGY